MHSHTLHIYINKISNVLISHSRHIRTSFEAYMHGKNFFSFRQLDRGPGTDFFGVIVLDFSPSVCVYVPLVRTSFLSL